MRRALRSRSGRAVACLNLNHAQVRYWSDERRYRLLKLLSEQPQASQRQLSQALGISVGSLNYAVNALIDRGWVKANNFRNSRNKRAYAYLLTPSGIDAKARIAVRFLKRKMDEYAALEQEIAQLRAEVAAIQDPKAASAAASELEKPKSSSDGASA